jgi:hypothetical protein
MHAKYTADEVVDFFGFIYPWVKPGDSVKYGNTIIVMNQEGLDCDCGKGLWCPFFPQYTASLTAGHTKE